MKELEKAIDQLKKENDRIEKAQNRAKLLNQKINKLKRNGKSGVRLWLSVKSIM